MSNLPSPYETGHLLGGWKFLASYLLLLPPLLGVISGCIVSWIVARRNVYINSITAERSKWLDKIRINVSEHTGLIGSIYAKVIVATAKKETPHDTGEKIAQDLSNLMRMQSLIRLQLNPKGSIDRQIISILDGMTLFVPDANDPISELDNILVKHFQFLLKDEWEKVKYEAGGFWRIVGEPVRSKRRSREYQEFLSGEGSFAELIEDIRRIRDTP